MKRLKFAEPLPQLVLEVVKDTTWRIGDEKLIMPGDLLSLCNIRLEEFAKAKVLWVKETTFENLKEEDTEGHEKFSSEKEMHQTYSEYYNLDVNSKTNVKIVKFKLCN